jgi:hypothetical protein
VSPWRAIPWLLVGALLACAGASPAPPPAPAAAAAPEAAPSLERQRFERWKQAEPAADPRPDFERQAEAEAERRRREALEAGAQLAPEAAPPEAAGD